MSSLKGKKKRTSDFPRYRNHSNWLHLSVFFTFYPPVNFPRELEHQTRLHIERFPWIETFLFILFIVSHPLFYRLSLWDFFYLFLYFLNFLIFDIAIWCHWIVINKSTNQLIKRFSGLRHPFPRHERLISSAWEAVLIIISALLWPEDYNSLIFYMSKKILIHDFS